MSNFTFAVTSSGGGSSSGGGGGGGGSTSTILKVLLLNGTPLLSFGINDYSFFVYRTPDEARAEIIFKNIGNVTFSDGKLELQGDIIKFISGSVCDINLSNCRISDISLKPGQN